MADPGSDASPGPALCAHCALPVGPTPARASEPVFCCVGCRLAAAVAGGEGGAGLLEARLLLSSFLAMGVMTFSLVLYGEAVYAPDASADLVVVRDLGRTVLALFALPVLLLLGVPLLHGAWADLRRGVVRMDGLIVLATAAAYGLSLYHTFAGGGEVYYDTATMVLVLVTFGRRLEANARTRGRDAADDLAACLPATAHRLSDGMLEDIDPAALAAGDLVQVLPGEAVPADVTVTDGASEAAAAHITGEESPRSVGPGDALPAGAVNGHGALTARVDRRALDGSLGRIRDLLEAPLTTTQSIRTADSLAGWLVTLAIALALIGGFRSWQLDGVGEGLRTALSVLLVACPCALGLATPLAYRAIRAALARRGVLVRDVRALEAAVHVDHIVLDKTGTLTDTGAARVAVRAGAAEACARMESLVAHSGHPLARTLSTRAHAPAAVQLVPGAGVVGEIAGVACRAGSPGWLDRCGMDWEPDLAAQREDLAADGATLVAYAEDGRVTALCALSHELRPGAVEAVAALRERGLEVEVLSGDRAAALEPIAAALGVSARGELTPEAKHARITELQRDGHRVLIAGDGMNDAPALREADVGVAMACGTALARAQAEVEVVGGDLRSLPLLLDAAHALRSTVRRNLFWCVLYNGAALFMATTGRLHPLIAVAAMIVSSLAVSARSYRLLDWTGARAAA